MSLLPLVLQFNLVLVSRWLRKAGNVILCLLLLALRGQRNEKEGKSFVTSGERFPRKTRSTKWKYWVRMMWFELRWFNITDRWLQTDCHDSWPSRVVCEKFEVRDIVIGLNFIIVGWSHEFSTKVTANFVMKYDANGQGWRIWFLLQSRFIGSCFN